MPCGTCRGDVLVHGGLRSKGGGVGDGAVRHPSPIEPTGERPPQRYKRCRQQRARRVGVRLPWRAPPPTAGQTMGQLLCDGDTLYALRMGYALTCYIRLLPILMGLFEAVQGRIPSIVTRPLHNIPGSRGCTPLHRAVVFFLSATPALPEGAHHVPRSEDPGRL